MIFDFVMIFSLLLLADEIYDIKKQKELFLIIYAVSAFLPTVFLNSAYWGKCDSIYTALVFLLFYTYAESSMEKRVFSMESLLHLNCR